MPSHNSQRGISLRRKTMNIFKTVFPESHRDLLSDPQLKSDRTEITT